MIGISACLLIVGGGIWCWQKAVSKGGKLPGIGVLVQENTLPRAEHKASFLTPEAYDRYFEAAQNKPVAAAPTTVISGVIPHHLVAGVFEARFFNALQNQEPPVVVVLGPNHAQAGRAPIISSLGLWKTAYGDALVDQKIVSALVDQKLVNVDENTIDPEHTIGAVVPFIKKTWPSAILVPLIVKENTSTSTLESLAKKLTEMLPKNSLVLASVDFSHYLPEPEATFHDELSENVLAVGDRDRALTLEVDSPKSLYFLLTYNSLKQAQKFTEVSRTNSGVISQNQNIAETTSHSIGYYTSGKSTAPVRATVQFFGDIMLDRNVAKAFGNDGLEYIFAKLKGQENRFFSGVSYFVANLEGPFAQARVATSKEIAFRFDPALAPQLKKYNFTAVSNANNHALDMGWANLDFTHETLDKAGIGHFGDELRQGPEYTWYSTIPGSQEKIAFIGLNTTERPLDMRAVKAAVVQARTEARYVLVMMHWGVEYQRISRQQERDLAHTLVDLGVNAVIGAHPHVVEESEIYKDAPIFYSLGNFVFDQYFSEDTQEGLSVGLVLEEGKVKKVYAFPLYSVASQPALMMGARRDAFIAWLNEKSRLGTKKFEEGRLNLY